MLQVLFWADLGIGSKRPDGASGEGRGGAGGAGRWKWMEKYCQSFLSENETNKTGRRWQTQDSGAGHSGVGTS